MSQAGLQYRERRDKLRLPFQRLIELTCEATAEQCQLEGVDYSPGGVAVRSREPLPVGSRVQLRFAVGRNRQTEMEIEGEIVHHRPRGEDYLVGICFVEPEGMLTPLPA